MHLYKNNPLQGCNGHQKGQKSIGARIEVLQNLHLKRLGEKCILKHWSLSFIRLKLECDASIYMNHVCGTFTLPFKCFKYINTCIMYSSLVTFIVKFQETGLETSTSRK